MSVKTSAFLNAGGCFNITSGCYGITSACFNITSRCYGITSACFNITSGCYGITSRCFNITSGCYGITSACFNITSRCYGITSACYGITSRCYGITSRCFNITSRCFGIALLLPRHLLVICQTSYDEMGESDKISSKLYFSSFHTIVETFRRNLSKRVFGKMRAIACNIEAIAPSPPNRTYIDAIYRFCTDAIYRVSRTYFDYFSKLFPRLEIFLLIY